MGILEILTIISTIIGVVGTAASSIAQNASNTKSVQETNDANLRIAQETNSSNVKQAELAYQRSLPTAQVRNLMSAGMSRAGALSSLTGGGSYTAPILQSATMQAPQKDFSGIASAFERLSNAPANMQQMSLIKEQRHALQVDTQNKIDANTRANEEHQMNMWRAQYDKDTVTALDASTNKLLNALLDYDGDVSQFKTYEQMVRGLGLQNDTMLRELPSSARSSLFNDVKSRFDDARAQQSSDDSHLAAQDLHRKTDAELRAMADQHNLSVKSLQDLNEHLSDYISERETRRKEAKIRALRSDLDSILAERDISLEQLQNDLIIDPDTGIPRLPAHIRGVERELWSTIGEIIPINYLAEILGVAARAAK